MANRILVLLVIGLVAAPAVACWDNSDQIVVKLKKLELSTDQLKDIFVFQKQHRSVIKRAHREGLGCRYHENHDAVFEKQAVCVLTNSQFKKHVGRTRTKVEGLEYDNLQLKKRIAKMEKELAELKKLVKAQQDMLKRVQEAQKTTKNTKKK